MLGLSLIDDEERKSGNLNTATRATAWGQLHVVPKGDFSVGTLSRFCLRQAGILHGGCLHLGDRMDHSRNSARVSEGAESETGRGTPQKGSQ